MPMSDGLLTFVWLMCLEDDFNSIFNDIALRGFNQGRDAKRGGRQGLYVEKS